MFQVKEADDKVSAEAELKDESPGPVILINTLHVHPGDVDAFQEAPSACRLVAIVVRQRNLSTGKTVRLADDLPNDVEFCLIAWAVHHDGGRWPGLAGKRMALGPARRFGDLTAFGVEHEVQAAVVARVQMHELAADHECHRRPPLALHPQRARTGRRDPAVSTFGGGQAGHSLPQRILQGFGSVLLELLVRIGRGGAGPRPFAAG